MEAAARDASDSSTAWVTMLTSDSFLIACEVLVKSLKKNMRAVRPIVVLCTSNISTHARKSLASWGAVVTPVDAIEAPVESAKLDGYAVAHVPGWLGTGYTKLRLWGLTTFTKIVYIDCDCLVLDDIDELFLRPGKPCPAAAPDVFPPDRFNAGVLVVEPSRAVFEDMLARKSSVPTYDGGDTGFLNAYFSTWFFEPAPYRLPFGFNAQRTLHWLTHDKQPGYWESIQPLRVIHYSSRPKPWEDGGKHKGPLEWLWWQSYMEFKAGSF
jgi:glycogenin